MKTKDKPVLDATLLWPQLERMSAEGHLRRLSGAFARFIDSLAAAPAPAPVLLAATMLSELEGHGHSCLQLAELVSAPAALMGWSEEQWSLLEDAAGRMPSSVAAWTELLARCPQVWVVGQLDYEAPLVLDGDRLYLRRYWRDETEVASAVRARAQTARTVDLPLVHKWLQRLFTNQPGASSPDWQKLACAIALRASFAIITGGPGTGKTYTVARLLALLFATADDPQRQRVALAAPTGKAAARLKQSIEKALAELAERVGDDLPLRKLTERMGAARTLHSLLGARPDTRSFVHHRGNQLDVDVLIVDEASMVHLEMMARLLDALPPHATLILLGDKDQLASVEAGAVLGDLCHDASAGAYSAETIAYVQQASGEIVPPEYLGQGGPLAQQTVMLRHSRRFSGPIGQLALAINDGDVDGATQILRTDTSQVRWIAAAQQTQLLQLAQQGYAAYLECLGAGQSGAHDDWARAVLQEFEAFRILCAVRAGEWGVAGLNAAIEARLVEAGLLRRSGEWYVGRPVMVTRNDYATSVFNGDIGVTLPDPLRPNVLRVYFLEGDLVRSVLATRLRNVETAFAMTVHKSQGSEFGHTVLALPREHNAILTRELIYTGITRASQQFTLVTPVAEVLFDAIDRRTQRSSGLRARVG